MSGGFDDELVLSLGASMREGNGETRSITWQLTTAQHSPPFGQSSWSPLGQCVSTLQFSSASKYELPQNLMFLESP